jgi:hypothetical protein
MQVGVSMNGVPSFVMHGKPQGHYVFTTTPTYYVAVKDAKVGQVISGTFISHPFEVQFPKGVTRVIGSLDDSLNFTFRTASLHQ